MPGDRGIPNGDDLVNNWDTMYSTLRFSPYRSLGANFCSAVIRSADDNNQQKFVHSNERLAIDMGRFWHDCNKCIRGLKSRPASSRSNSIQVLENLVIVKEKDKKQ